jgi:hypothetical protein
MPDHPPPAIPGVIETGSTLTGTRKQTQAVIKVRVHFYPRFEREGTERTEMTTNNTKVAKIFNHR